MKKVCFKLVLMVAALIISNNVNAAEIGKDTELQKNMFSKRGADTTPLLVISKGADVKVIRAEGKELLVTYNSTEGWIPKSSIKHVKKTMTKEDIAKQKELKAKILALRKEQIEHQRYIAKRLKDAEDDARLVRADAIISFERFLHRADSLSGYHEMQKAKAELYLDSIGRLEN